MQEQKNQFGKGWRSFSTNTHYCSFLCIDFIPFGVSFQHSVLFLWLVSHSILLTQHSLAAFFICFSFFLAFSFALPLREAHRRFIFCARFLSVNCMHALKPIRRKFLCLFFHYVFERKRQGLGFIFYLFVVCSSVCFECFFFPL